MSNMRILLKLSGECLMGSKPYGHDLSVLKRIASDIKDVVDMGVELCIVVGGGNIYRGINASTEGMDRSAADYMGMLATVINAIALQNILEQTGIYTRVQSAIPMQTVSEPYIWRKAIRHMEKGRVVIFAAGTGNPYFSTDTAAVLRAVEMNCGLLLKGTKVDGVYSKDPEKFSDYERYQKVSYSEVLNKNLNVMDMAAIALARENNLKIKVFSILEHGNIKKVINNEGNFTLIQD